MEKLFTDIEYTNKSIQANEEGKYLYQFVHDIEYEIDVPEYDENGNPIMIEVVDPVTGETVIVQKTHQETRTKQVCELLIDDEFKYLIFDGNYTNCELNPDYEDLTRAKIGQLHMTPLDFIKCLEEKGVSYSTIIGLCNQNAEVDKQLRFCNHVYRGNELLDQLAGGFGITSEELDKMFADFA